jgi:BlaI family transcriptional regulator, penicillinase repressor
MSVATVGLGRAACAKHRCVLLIVTRRRVNKAMNHAPTELGNLERQVMQLMWSHDHLTADTLCELLAQRRARRLKDPTVRTVLRRLEEKGYVAHSVDGRTFVYHATEPRSRVAARAVKHIVDWFCDGSLDEVLVGMVDSAMLDRRELNVLADRIRKTKRGRK